MRLIDADKLRKDFLDLPNCYNGFSDAYDKALIIDLVDEQPTVDAESVRHGHWEHLYGGQYKCSNCGAWWGSEYADEITNDFYYCPNCGAKMDGKRREDA